MLDIAKDRSNILLNNGFESVKFIQVNLYKLSTIVEEMEFDFVYSIGTIGYHVPFDVNIARMIYSKMPVMCSST